MQYHRYQLSAVELVPDREKKDRSSQRMWWMVFAVLMIGCPASTSNQKPTDNQTAETPEAKSNGIANGVVSESIEPGSVEVATQSAEFESEGVKLKGEFFVPEGENPKTIGVLLVHEWGPWDRFGTARESFGLRLGSEVQVYREIAQRLSEAGLVVFTYDKRSCIEGASTRCAYKREYVSSVELNAAFENDAKRALETLSAHPSVDPTQLLVVGHGQGSALASKLTQNENVIGAIYLNPYAQAPDEIAMYQTQKSLDLLDSAISKEASRMSDIYKTQRTTLTKDLKAQKSTFSAIRKGNRVEVAFGMPGKTWRRFIDDHDGFETSLNSSTKPSLVVLGDSVTNAPDDRDTFRKIADANDQLRFVEVAGMSQLLVRIDQPTQSIPEALIDAMLRFVSGDE